MNKSERTGTIEFPREQFLKPIDLLRRLANARLPTYIADVREIEALRILKLGGSIKAAIPEALGLPGGLAQGRSLEPATVAEITHLGRRMLELFARGGCPAGTSIDRMRERLA